MKTCPALIPCPRNPQFCADCADNSPPAPESLGAGICDFCGEQAPSLSVFNHAPAAGLCYCERCATHGTQ